MNNNPYRLTPDPTPDELARAELVEQILEDLFEHHISIIGPRHYGKTVFAAAVAKAARACGHFSDVVFWDLRHFTPASDAEFFAKFAETLVEQLTCVGEDAKNHFANDADRTYSRIRGFFEYLQGLEKRILIIMDGMDDPLDCEVLTKSLWDNLTGFSKIGSANLLATSRKPLRQLCKNSNGRSSDFWVRFEDPPTRLKAFDPHEITNFLKPLIDAHGGLATGAETEFARWTGGIPWLAVCLGRKLYESANSPLTVENVRDTAKKLLADNADSLDAAWDIFTAEEQTGFADLIEKGEIEQREAGKIAHSLVQLGLAHSTGAKIAPRCELLQQFTAHLQSGLVTIKLLFGDLAAYERNITAVVEWRLRHISIKDPELRDNVSDAVERVGNARLFFKEVRNIVSHTLVRIWKFESPDGNSPRYEGPDGQRAGPLRLEDDYNLIMHLQAATNIKNHITLKKANRRIYALLSALLPYGDLGQHQGNQELSNTHAACACLTLLELAAELDKAGF
jgi:hypothetical protein